MANSGTNMLPGLYGVIEAPAPLLSSARFKIIHNKALKNAIRTLSGLPIH